jgi:hypothetical protein
MGSAGSSKEEVRRDPEFEPPHLPDSVRDPCILRHDLEPSGSPPLRTRLRFRPSGKFAGIAFEPDELRARVARATGWNRSKPVFALHAAAVRNLAKTDYVAHHWFAAKPRVEMSKLFVFIHSGTLLVNHDADKGFYIEPGSTGPQLAQ